MKVLAINGSPRKDGTTNAALYIATEELKKFEIGIETMHVGYSLIRGCVACNACKGIENLAERRCIFTQDIVNEAIAKAAECDGFIFASPVHYGGITGSMKAFMDRFFFAGGENLNYKVATAIIALRRSGGTDAFQQIHNYLQLSKVITPPSHYWNVVHGNSAEELRQDQEGIQIIESLARNMAWLMQTVEYGKKHFPMPDLDQRKE